MQAASAEGSEGGAESPHQEQELPQSSLSCGDGGFGPRAAAEGDEETPPEAEAGSAEPALTLVSGVRKEGEEPERAEGGALEVDPLPEVQWGQKTGPRPSIEGPVPVTEGAQEEPLKQLLPRASLSGGGEGSGPCAAVGGAVGGGNIARGGEGGEGPKRVDPLPSRAEDGPETVPRTSKEGPRAGTKPSGSAAYAERPSAPPKSRVQTVPARVPPPVSPAASPGGGAQGGPVKLKIRRNALTHQRECVVLYHREGGDGELREREEDTESTGSVGSESLSAPSPKLLKSAKPPAQAPHPSGSTSPSGPSKRPAEGGKKTPAPLPVTSGGEKGEKAPEAAGPSTPSKTAPGEKAAEWTTVARRKKKAAARSTGAAEQGAMKPAAAPSGGGSGGGPGKGTPSTAPPKAPHPHRG
ncbi:UNVERIFIED_CONTAM: hypothetical protein FKN15_045642 [Acipenser sinensis]